MYVIKHKSLLTTSFGILSAILIIFLIWAGFVILVFDWYGIYEPEQRTPTPYTIGHTCERFTGTKVVITNSYYDYGKWYYDVRYVDSSVYVNGLVHDLIYSCEVNE